MGKLKSKAGAVGKLKAALGGGGKASAASAFARSKSMLRTPSVANKRDVRLSGGKNSLIMDESLMKSMLGVWSRPDPEGTGDGLDNVRIRQFQRVNNMPFGEEDDGGAEVDLQERHDRALAAQE